MPRPAKELFFNKRCEAGNVRACIHRGALHWGQSYGFMRDLARCESNFNPRAHNTQGSGATGLFQFMPGTWAGTPYRGYSIYSAKYQSLSAGWMLARGRRNEWAC